jgi:hypothetical protein
MIDKIIPPIAHALMPSFTPAFGVFALTYCGSQGNSAAFETLEKTRVSGSVAVAALETNQGKPSSLILFWTVIRKAPRLSIVLQIGRMESGALH